MEWLGELFEGLSNTIDASDAINNATQAVVDLADLDNSGDIGLSDIVEGLNNVPEKVIELVDLDGSGSVSSNDLTRAVFDFIDKNGSGKLDSEDFNQLLIGFLDKNGDGKFNSIDIAIRRSASEVGENFGPLAKIAFQNVVKNLL